MSNMPRIVILGCPSSGKSTIAQEISELLKLKGYTPKFVKKESIRTKLYLNEKHEAIQGKYGTEILIDVIPTAKEK